MIEQFIMMEVPMYVLICVAIITFVAGYVFGQVTSALLTEVVEEDLQFRAGNACSCEDVHG